MLNIIKTSRRAIIILAGSAAISAASIATTTGIANAGLSWKKHACWCKSYKGRLHGTAYARAAGVVGPVVAALPRKYITLRAIAIAQRDSRVGFAHFAICQFHNRNGLMSLVRNRYAVARWLQNGGQC